MTDKADHIAWAAEAVAVFQRRCRTGDEHAIADLICDLGHLAEERGLDFLSEVRRGIGQGASTSEIHRVAGTAAQRPLERALFAVTPPEPINCGAELKTPMADYDAGRI